jgi:hypothetical protein
MSKLETAVEELKTLPPTGLAVAADFIHQLKLSGAAERERALDRAFGSFSTEEADEVERAINANCERIDASEW